MIQADIDYNTQVRQRFGASCLVVTHRIVTLQKRNEQLSAELLMLIEKRKALLAVWLAIEERYLLSPDALL